MSTKGKNELDAHWHAPVRVSWLVDVTGWAYDNRARNISRRLPIGYAHNILTAYCPNVLRVLENSDISVINDARLLTHLQRRDNVVLNLNAVKLFDYEG